MVELVALDSHGERWRVDLDELYQRLGGGQNASLLPYHFLQAAFPHIGGEAIRVERGAELIGAAFALPYNRAPVITRQTPAYVIRYHMLPTVVPFNWETLRLQFTQLLQTDYIVFYDPTAAHVYTPTHHLFGGVDIGRPSAEEAATIRTFQQQIWGSPPEFLYPVDLHSSDFPLGTSLVARVDEAVAGFLFGFYKRGGPTLPGAWTTHEQSALRVESQLMGVLPAYRGLRLSYLLKKVQAENALAQGIGVIHWTVDPLQYTNAALNFGLLRAVCFTFTPDYYPFRNDLNRSPASRLSLTWLIGSARVRDVPLFEAQSTIFHLVHHPDIVRVNQGWQRLEFTVNAPLIAIEIPATWTKLQQEQPGEALQWRTATDQLFSHYLGNTPGHYVITDVGVDGDQRFLIAQRAEEALWARLERA